MTLCLASGPGTAETSGSDSNVAGRGYQSPGGMLGPGTFATYARFVPEHIIDGERWIAERLAFLGKLLRGTVDAETRRAIEAEIAVLSKERGIAGSGVRADRIGRWFRRRA